MEWRGEQVARPRADPRVKVFWMALASLAVAAGSPLVWIRLLRRWQVIDIPNARSSHTLPAVRGVGLGAASSILTALVLVVLTGQPSRHTSALVVVLGVALGAAALGFLEDVVGLSIAQRAGTQLVLGGLLGASLCYRLNGPWWLAAFVAIAFAGYVNVANFMDGIDGISALHGIAAGVHFLLVGLLLAVPWIACAGAATAVAFLGFAPWNLARGRVFLGDVGSYLLGAMVAGCGVAVFLIGGTFLLAVAPALPYLVDTGSTLVLRLRRGEQLLAAHRSHVYQRLTDSGLTHLGSSAVVTGCSVICSAAAFWTAFHPAHTRSAILVMALVLIIYLSTPRWPVRVELRRSP
jgi:UDP-N-acetylmuramyl pentapeptide phosphotransferase/UDP-N-acetylglucosamine-1-phosphate transferase